MSEIEQLLEEMAELDAALAKALRQRDRWMREARYWYYRAGTAGMDVMPVVYNEEPVPVVSGGVQVAEL